MSDTNKKDDIYLPYCDIPFGVQNLMPQISIDFIHLSGPNYGLNAGMQVERLC